jgi:hypothetical protein
MKAEQIRNMAKQAVEQVDCGLAMEVCKHITNPDIFIGDRASVESTWKGDLTRPLDYPGRCNECGEWIPVGVIAVWIKDAGVWHVNHYKA